jgi:hypothetical protein
MKNIKVRKAFIVAVALSGVVLNILYGIKLLTDFFDPQYNGAIREILIAAIILEFSWAFLLLWVAVNPFERRHILLFTIVPILSGNILHSVSQQMDTPGGYGAMVLNTIFGFFYAGLYAAAFFLGKPDKKQIYY